MLRPGKIYSSHSSDNDIPNTIKGNDEAIDELADE